MDASEVLVTGGTGVLGRQVVDRLRAAGHNVRVLRRSGRPGTVRGDLMTGENLEEAVDGIKTIIHLVSNPYRETRQTDVGGTERLLLGGGTVWRIARRVHLHRWRGPQPALSLLQGDLSMTLSASRDHPCRGRSCGPRSSTTSC